MADITATSVKELREMTGAGMMECKKALTEANGDMDKAVDVLRTRGLAAVEKKAGRETNEGTIVTAVSDDGKKGAIIEIDCETDFVAINDKFKAYAIRIANAALINGTTDIDALKSASIDGETVEAIITDAIHVLGENIQIARVAIVEGDAVVSYTHGVGNIAVLVKFDIDKIEATNADFVTCGRDVAMQIAALNPVSPTRERVPADVVEHEKSIYAAQAAESGKPEAIQQKIAEGRMEKYYKEHCLTEQEFVKDSEKTVAGYVDGVAKEMGGTIKIVDFVRFQLGE